AGVDDAVAVLKLQPAQDAWIDDDAELDVLVEAFRKVALKTVPVLGAELDCRGDSRPNAPSLVVGQALIFVVDLTRFVDPARLDQQPREVGSLAVQHGWRPGHQRLALLGRDGG